MARRPAGPAAGAHGGSFVVGNLYRSDRCRFHKNRLRRTLVCGGAISSLRRRSDHLFGIPSIRFALDSIGGGGDWKRVDFFRRRGGGGGLANFSLPPPWPLWSGPGLSGESPPRG